MKEEQKITGAQIPIEFPVKIQDNKIVSDKVENKQTLVDALTWQSDQFAKESARLRTERENEKIKFLGGAEFSIREIKEFIIANAQPYSPMFPNKIPFFKEMYRLNKWEDRDSNEWIKPLQVPGWINELIYNRFPKEVLPAIQILNPYLSGMCIRGFKNFQFLNAEGQRLVLEYRDQAVALMEKFNTWHEFRLEMVKEHGVPYTYQTPMF